jgi:leucyl aminopeptidase
MKNINRLIVKAKKLIDLPHNKFNLDNYYNIISKEIGVIDFIRNPNSPTQLMSGFHPSAGIIKTPGRGKIYIIGKGILFDSGGYNLKTGRKGSYGMHGDKAGMIIALSVAKNIGKNVIAYCPVTTNFLHNSKITPGDIIKIGNIDVEVNNTDAEGRLILAEAISNLNVSKNDIIITIATLTGCCEYAVDKATGVFGENDKLINKYLEASKEEKEYAWALPLFDYMQKFYKKQPIKNSEDKIKAGASEGAMFIKQFIKYPENWLHLDIAAVAHKDNKATGIPIKSLINFIKKLL